MKKLIYIALAIAISVISLSCETDTVGDLIDDSIDVIYFEEDSVTVLENLVTPIEIQLNSIKSGNSASLTLGGTAIRGEDYSISDDDINISFADGVYTTSISISLIDNNVTDGDRTIILSLPMGQGFGEESRREYVITKLDDDLPSGTVVAVIDGEIEDESDDAEEGITGSSPGIMDLSSSDLEIGEKEGNTRGAQMIGLRFNNLIIPQGVKITAASIQFTVDEEVDDPAPVVMDIYAEAVDNSSTFTSDDFNMSSRPRTTASVAWEIPVWTTVGDASADQKTVDISDVIEEIVNRQGWVGGNSISIIMIPTAETLLNPTESGRVAEDGDDDKAPVLTIDWER